MTPGTCSRPDPGWVCSGDEGHDGPCAAWPLDQRLDPSYEELEQIYEFGLIALVIIVFGLVAIGVVIGLLIAALK